MPPIFDIPRGPKPQILRLSRRACGQTTLDNHCPLYHYAVACKVDPNFSYHHPHLPYDLGTQIWQAWDRDDRSPAQREAEVIRLFASINVTVEFVP